MQSPRARLALLVCLALVTACGGGESTPAAPPPPPPPPVAVVTAVEISPASTRVVAPGTASFAATVKDQRGDVMTGKVVTWSSSNTTVATVDAAGAVSVLAAGEATITASVEGKSATAQVTGLAAIATLAAAPDSLVLSPGDTVTLVATMKDALGNAVTGRTVTWTTSAPAIATISASGLVTAIGTGPVTFTAAVEGKSASVAAQVGRAVQQLPRTSCTNCLEIVPSSALLRATGAQQLLQAFRVDANGRRTLVRPTWRSSRPAEASVNANGLVTAMAPLGAAQVTATDGNLTAAPAMIVMTTPVANAVLVSDAQVVGSPVAVDSTAKFGRGFRYRVKLRGVAPSPGQVVLATEQAPVAGRVVSVTTGVDSTVDVVLETVPLGSLVSGLRLNERLPLPAERITASMSAPANGRVQPSFARTPHTPTSFSAGPFTCQSTIQSSSPIISVTSANISITPSLTLTHIQNGTTLERLTVDGSLDVSGTAELRLPSSVQGVMDCKWEIRRIPLPFTGFLSAILAGEVPVGLGFQMDVDLGVGNAGVDITLNGQTNVSVGFLCDPAGTCPIGGTATTTLTPTVKPVLPSLVGGVKVDVRQQAYAFAELGLGSHLLPSVLKVKVVEARVGLQQTLSMASAAYQQADPSYASSHKIGPFLQITSGLDLTALGGLLSLQLVGFTLEPSLPLLARTPLGTLTITPRVAAGTPQTLGEMATFTVTLDSVAFLGTYTVVSVEILWLKPDASGTPTLQNGRPGCTSLQPSASDQTTFTCETDFLEADAGLQTFYAFVRVKEGGVVLPVPLEIANNGMATVDVQVVSVQVSPDPVTVAPGNQQAFQALVTGASNTGVTWRATGGTISSGGLYTAGTATGTFFVVATSVAFPDKRDSAVVTIAGNPLSLGGSLPAGGVGAAYSGNVFGAGGAGAGSYRYASVSGRPPGLSVGATSGAVTGTPTQGGTFAWVIEVTSGSQSARRTFNVQIVAPSTDPLLGPSNSPSSWTMRIADVNNGGQQSNVPFSLAKGTQGPQRYQMLFGGFFSCFILLSSPTLPSAFTGNCAFGVSGQTTISGNISQQSGSGVLKAASGLALFGAFTLTRQ